MTLVNLNVRLNKLMKRKNILLITSDQHHWHAMGYNNPEIKTPNLDRLAANGTRLHPRIKSMRLIGE